MILVKPSFEILEIMGVYGDYGIGRDALQLIEKAGRTCYKSEEKITEDSCIKFVDMVTKRGHESVLEHSAITVKIICDRGVTHEIVRHRLAAYSQESTRYCNYKGGVTFVIPPWVDIKSGEYEYDSALGTGDISSIKWAKLMWDSEWTYVDLVKLHSWTPQQARSVLPNSTKTEIVITANIREWRHILKLRTSKAAHPQMQEIMIPILKEFNKLFPILFADIPVPTDNAK